MDIKSLLESAVEKYASRTAVICEGKSMTYKELQSKQYKLINGLFANGLRKQDHVAVLAPNCLDYVVVDWALAGAGLVRVGLNYRLSEKELIDTMNDAEVKALIVHESLMGIVDHRGAFPNVKFIVVIGEERDRTFAVPDVVSFHEVMAQYPDSKPQVTVQDGDIYQLMYTSGTTGKPKGVILTHQIIFQVVMNQLADTFPATLNDAFLLVGHLSHAGNARCLPFYAKGAKVVLLPKFTPEAFFETVEKEKVTMTSLVPTTLNMLLNFENRENYDYSTLKLVTYGASPMPVEKLRQAMNIFGPVLYQSYGQTEAMVTISYMSKEEHVINLEACPERLSSAGRPHTGVHVKIVDDQGQEVGVGEVGEVIVSGAHIMKGYWKRPKETEETLKGRWIYTGDLGRKDEEGYLYLVGRKKQMIISGGLNVYPVEVEQVIYNHPGVNEAIVYGVPDEKWGEMVVASVVLKPDHSLTSEELQTFCKQFLAGYKCPKKIEFVPDLPKNATGKIIRPAHAAASK